MAKSDKRDDEGAAGELGEGPRGFSPLLQHVDDGDLHDELSRELQRIAQVCRDHARRFQRPAKGTLTLTLTLTAAGDTVGVRGEVKTKEPKATRAGSVFWMTPAGNLTVENPRQQKLPLREVPASTTRTKDLSAEPPTRAL